VMFPMTFLFLGGRLAIDLLNTVIARDLLGRREDVAAWGAAAGVVADRDLRNAAREPAGLRAFREALRRGLVAWAAAGTPPAPLVLDAAVRRPRQGPRVLPAPPGGHEAGGDSAPGSHTVNVLPAPGVESTVMWPPCSSASSRAMARPRPLPPRSRLRD